MAALHDMVLMERFHLFQINLRSITKNVFESLSTSDDIHLILWKPLETRPETHHVPKCWALSKESSGTIFVTPLVWCDLRSHPRPPLKGANALWLSHASNWNLLWGRNSFFCLKSFLLFYKKSVGFIAYLCPNRTQKWKTEITRGHTWNDVIRVPIGIGARLLKAINYSTCPGSWVIICYDASSCCQTKVHARYIA